MRSTELGKRTSKAEVVNISSQGVWLSVRNKEYFLPYEEFPWFKEANIAAIQDVDLIHGHALHWKKLDVDLSLDSLEHPEHYPLKYQ